MKKLNLTRSTGSLVLTVGGLLLLLSLALTADVSDTTAQEPLRIIAFGAHPDDCEIRAGGVAALWAKQGHRVKFVSVTNGDIGHSVMAGGPLALRRTQEVEAAAKVLGIEAEVLDNHDGELLPTLENRKEIIRLIREWDADLVLTNRPNDYHPDHRYTSILVQDAAYMVTVPFICPDVKPLDKNPVFMYWGDRFQKPYPFDPILAVSIDEVAEQKYQALTCLVSQFLEYGADGNGDPATFFQGSEEERLKYITERFSPRFQVPPDLKPLLVEFYGQERADRIRSVEAFELCEYGRQPSKEELKQLFPFFN